MAQQQGGEVEVRGKGKGEEGQCAGGSCCDCRAGHRREERRENSAYDVKEYHHDISTQIEY